MPPLASEWLERAAVSAARYAVADVGSNTLHLLTAKSDGAHLRPLHEESVRLRLGADVARAGAISTGNLEAALLAIERFVTRAKRAGVETMRLLGTQPIRGAANARSLAKAVQRGTGLRLHTLTPETEALLGYVGTTIDHPGLRPGLIVDIGGGSTQVSIVDKKERFRFSCSVPVGTINLPVRFLEHDPPRPDEVEALVSAVNHAVAPIGQRVLEAGIELDRGVLIGGLARRLHRAGRRAQGASLTRSWLERFQTAAMEISGDGFEALGAARQDEIDMLRAGSTILLALMHSCRVPAFSVSRYGIREGAVLLLARGRDVPGFH